MEPQTSFSDICRSILLIRGRRVMLDSDMAKLYNVTTKRLNEQVHRNIKRFPVDFMFTLSLREFSNLKSQFATSSLGWGGRRKLPRVFTQEGVAMLSGILHSNRAIAVNIAIMRAFVKLRETLSMHKDLVRKLDRLERTVEGHGGQIHSLFEAIRQPMAPPETPRRRIGFQP